MNTFARGIVPTFDKGFNWSTRIDLYINGTVIVGGIGCNVANPISGPHVRRVGPGPLFLSVCLCRPIQNSLTHR